MRFNARKCHILSIKPKSSFFYCLCNTILKQVLTNLYLGTLLSEDLTWSSHIANITKTANCTLGFLRQNPRR